MRFLFTILMVVIFMTPAFGQLKAVQSQIDTQPVIAALNVLPKKFKVPSDVIRYVSIDRDFPSASNEWKSTVRTKLAFTSTGHNYVFFNIDVVSPLGKRGQDPYTAAINWRKSGMPVSPATYIIAAVLAHEYYGHGPGCVEEVKVCENELRALEIERLVYMSFVKNSVQFSTVNQRAGFNHQYYLDQIDELIKNYSKLNN